MKRSAVFALAAVVAGGLWLSGSSTFRLGDRHHIPALAQPALLLVLEVAAVIGTALWVTASPGRERRKPALVVLGSSGVAAVGGWQAYGWLGLVAPAAVVIVTDMIAERWGGMSHATAEPPDMPETPWDGSGPDDRPTLIPDDVTVLPSYSTPVPTTRPRRDGLVGRPPSYRPRPALAAVQDDPGTDPVLPVPTSRPTSVPLGRPTVPSQANGQDAIQDGERDEPERPTDDELLARMGTWDDIPGVGTISARLGVGKPRAGRLQGRARDARTSQDASRAVPTGA